MTRIAGILTAIILTFVLLYLSPFWIWQASWSNDGLFAIKALSPRGDVVHQLLRGTQLSVFDVVIWFVLSIAVLSGLQWIYSRFAK